MARRDLVLGIDSSTQGTTAVLLSRDDWSQAGCARVGYREIGASLGLSPETQAPLLAPLEPGEASQPPELYTRALGAVFDALGPDLLGRVAAINISAQQHGQVWLSERGAEAIASLAGPEREFRAHFPDGDPASLPPGAFALGRAPIWMCSNTGAEAARIRDFAGGRAAVTELSGSDSPLRFSGAVLRRMAKRFPAAYGETCKVHLISSFLTAYLSGRPEAPIDWGNGAGMSLMNYSARRWDSILAEAVAGDLPGGAEGLARRLPGLTHPLAVTGAVAPRLAERYGFAPDCLVVAGSGDNPQSKVLASGTLLSLGTSFVLMSPGTRPDPQANAMYDGTGEPFVFGCRTNGALVWEAIRLRHGIASGDFASSDAALASLPAGTADPDFIFQPEVESFPESPPTGAKFSQIAFPGSFAAEYAGVVDSSLGLMYLASASFAGKTGEVAVTGGAAASAAVLARVAAFWDAPVSAISEAGASTGAAVAAGAALAGAALAGAASRREILEEARMRAGRRRMRVEPDAEAVRAAHGPGGYLERLAERFAERFGSAW